MSAYGELKENFQKKDVGRDSGALCPTLSTWYDLESPKRYILGIWVKEVLNWVNCLGKASVTIGGSIYSIGWDPTQKGKSILICGFRCAATSCHGFPHGRQHAGEWGQNQHRHPLTLNLNALGISSQREALSHWEILQQALILLETMIGGPFKKNMFSNSRQPGGRAVVVNPEHEPF